MEDEKPTTELHLDSIINQINCRVHKAKPGEPCHTIPKTNRGHVRAVCNLRARAYGMRGVIKSRARGNE